MRSGEAPNVPYFVRIRRIRRLRPAGSRRIRGFRCRAVSDLPRPGRAGGDGGAEAAGYRRRDDDRDLIQPARFGWPARFICRRFAGEAKPLRVVGASVDDLNGKLEAMDVAVEDCRGGFSIRSLKPQPGKLDQIIGNAQ